MSLKNRIKALEVRRKAIAARPREQNTRMTMAEIDAVLARFTAKYPDDATGTERDQSNDE